MPRVRGGQGPGRAGRSRRCQGNVDLEATMRADLDLLCISVYCTADDLLPARAGNARRKLSDAEIVTLSVAVRWKRPAAPTSLTSAATDTARATPAGFGG